MRLAQECLAEICQIQQDFLAKCSITQKEPTINKPVEDMIAAIKAIVSDERLNVLHGVVEKNQWEATYKAFENEIKEALEEQITDETNDRQAGHIREAFFLVVKEWIRKRTINEGKRVDGR